MSDMPKVGIGALIFKDNKILMMKRKSELGKGCWSTGGEHLEFGETPEQALKREIKEEYGIEMLHSTGLRPVVRHVKDFGVRCHRSLTDGCAEFFSHTKYKISMRLQHIEIWKALC